jgi:hypothetical protein
MDVAHVKTVLAVYATFKQYCAELKSQFQNYNRISDFDNIAIEIIQVFILNLIINMYNKYRSSKENKRRDAQMSAKLASVILVQFFDKRRPHFRQFEQALAEITTWNNKEKNKKECYISSQEIDFYANL